MTPHQHPNRAIGAMTADFSCDDTLSLCFPLKRISNDLLCLAKNVSMKLLNPQWVLQRPLVQLKVTNYFTCTVAGSLCVFQFFPADKALYYPLTPFLTQLLGASCLLLLLRFITDFFILFSGNKSRDTLVTESALGS